MSTAMNGSRCLNLTLRGLATTPYSDWKIRDTQNISYCYVSHTCHVQSTCLLVQLTIYLALDLSVLKLTKVHLHLSPLQRTHHGLWAIFSSNAPSHYLSSTTSSKSRCMPNIHKPFLVPTIWRWVRGRVLDGDLKTSRQRGGL